MLFGANQKLCSLDEFHLTIDGHEIERVESYLGIMLDPVLLFSALVKYIQSKTFGRIKVLARARSFLDQEMCLSLYKSLVLPLFDFNDFIYDCLSSNDTYTLQKLQNAAFRNILRSDSCASIVSIHEKLAMPLLERRRFWHTANEMYKVVNSLAPLHIVNRFAFVDEVTGVVTQASHCGDLYMPPCRLQKTKHSFVYCGIMVWKSIPMEV